MPKSVFLVGCDPELFLKDPRTNSYVSAHDVIPGSKIEPFKVTSGAIQVDGAAAEFNTDPASSAKQFVTNISQVMTELKARTGDFELVLDPTVTFEPSYFNSLPDVVKELGCNPDFNAYTKNVNPAPDGASITMRTASGHVHVGWCDNVNPMDPMHFDDCVEVIKQLDFFLGLPSLAWDPDGKRRGLYGKAGAFRPKPYGVEYRTMSNVWLRSNHVQSWIFDAVQHSLSRLQSDKKSFFDVYGSYARDCIDNNVTDWFKTQEGKKIWSQTGLVWPETSGCLNFYEKRPQAVMNKNTKKGFVDYMTATEVVRPRHKYKKRSSASESVLAIWEPPVVADDMDF